MLVTSGPTHEYLDPVRFLTNPSSGKMGAALARRGRPAGITVHLVSGPVSASSLPSDCAKIHRITTAEQMLRVVRSLSDQVNIFVFAAAVSDFRVAAPPSKDQAYREFACSPAGRKPGHRASDRFLPSVQARSPWDSPQRPTTLRRMRSPSSRGNTSMPLWETTCRIPYRISPRRDNEVTIYLRDGEKVHVSRRPKSEVAREVFGAILPMVKQAARA